MPNMIFTKDACRQIVTAGLQTQHESTHDIKRGKRNECYQPIIQVSIHITGSMSSLNPTWHKEEGWRNRRWAFATVIDEDGSLTNRVVKVYSTMSVDRDWTNTDSIGGLNNSGSGQNSSTSGDQEDWSNINRFACVLIHGRWHILAPMMLASATLRVAWNGLLPGGQNSTTGY